MKVLVVLNMAFAGLLFGVGTTLAFNGPPVAAAGLCIGAGLFAIAAALFGNIRN